jgi:hypothetical protein
LLSRHCAAMAGIEPASKLSADNAMMILRIPVSPSWWQP